MTYCTVSTLFRLSLELTLAVAAAMLMFMAGNTATAQEVVVERGVGVTIVLPSEPSPAEYFAARELGEHLQSMLAAKTTTVKGAVRTGESGLVFYVGATENNRSYRDTFDRRLTGPGPDSFVVVQAGRDLHLVGGGDRGTLHAVYDWLERQGCRWFSPGPEGQVVPELEGLTLTDGRWRGEPRNITREIGGDAGSYDPWEYLLWQRRNRLNRSFALRDGYVQVKYPQHPEMADAWARLGGMERWHWIAHNFAFMFDDPQAWFEKRPDFFALYNGRRVPPGSPGRPGYGGGNLALINLAVVEHCAEFAIRWFDQHPNGTVVPMWPGDGAIKWDESPEAQALGGKNFTAGPEGSMTRRMVTFVNRVARRVAEVHPDRLILLPAYQNYIRPVDDLAIEPNVFVQYCYHGDYAHGPQQSPVNASSAQEMRDWAGKVPGRFGVWEYFLIGDHTVTEPQPVLLPLVYRVRDTLQFLDSIGSTRYFTQSTTAYQPYNPLLYYALSRYMWDPSLDADELIRDYAIKSYGDEAGPVIAEFYIALEGYVQASEWRPQLYPDVAVPSPEVFSEEHAARLNALLSAADAVELTPEQNRRLQMLRQAFDYSVANAATQSLAGLSADQPWRLERGKSIYTVNADAPDVDPRRFEDLRRQALDTGTAGADFDRLVFRARKRSEPIVAIENRAVRVEVVPGLGGRLIRLIDLETGHNYMKESPEGDTLSAIGAGYFHYGGYEEYLGEHFAGPGWETSFHAEVRRGSDASSIHLTAELDGLRWERTYRIEAGGDPTLRLTSRLINLSDSPRNLTLRTHPQFDLGGDIEAADLLMRLEDGRWFTTRPQQEHDGLTQSPRGAWALVHPASERALLHRFDSEVATPYFFRADSGQYAQLELMGKPRQVPPGRSWEITQAITVGDPSAIRQRVNDNRQTAQPLTPAAPVRSETSAPFAGEARFTRGIMGDALLRHGGEGVLTYDGARFSPAAGTLEFWVKLPEPPAGPAPVWLVSVGENDPEWFYLVYENGKLSWCMKSGRAPYTEHDMFYLSLSTAADLADGAWHQVAVTWEQPDAADARVRIYLDGRLAESRDDTRLGHVFAAERFCVGGSSATATPEHHVAIDEVRLSSRPLTEAELAANYHATRQGQATPPDASATLLLPFDGSTTAQTPSGESVILPTTSDPKPALHNHEPR